MKYRNGKCYDDFGNEISQSQINQMYEVSKEYISQICKPSKDDEMSRDELMAKLSQNASFKIK